MQNGITSNEVVVSLEGISKCFRRYSRPVDRLKEILLPGKSYAGEFWALRDINLQVHRGETLGIIGKNGSGKSTLLQIIAGTLQPTTGTRHVQGRVSALLELGSGFNPEFTGRQNVFFNGQILGLTQAEVAAKFDEIATFAGIGEFIDQPVKVYSSGMFVRLAFAVAIHVDPDILIVDEALAVGDGIFVHRCMAKIQEFQAAGGTILFVSHDVSTITRLCNRAAWINEGRMIAVDEPPEIARRYQAWIYDQIHATQQLGKPAPQVANLPPQAEEPKTTSSPSPSVPANVSQNPFTGKPYHGFWDVSRFGTGRAEILSFKVLDANGQDLTYVHPGDEVNIVVRAIAFDTITNPIIGITIHDRLRTLIFGFNTYQLKRTPKPFHASEEIQVGFRFEWPTIQGENYSIETAIANGIQDNHEMLDWLQCPLNIMSGTTSDTVGIVRLANIQVSHEVLANIS